MADEDLASQEAEGAVVDNNDPPDQDGRQQADSEPISNLARDLGWTTREEWEAKGGDPDKWKPAEQFIRDGREIQQTTARELRSLREQMDRVGSVTETIVNDRVNAARAQWEAEMTRAVEDGDTATALRLARQEPQAQPAGNAEFESWKAKNSWFVTNPLAQAVAIDAAERVKHLPPAQQFEMAERAVKRDFPELFPQAQTAKPPPATQTAATRSAAPTNRQKGFADMPAASQQVARQMIERHPGLTLEAFAKSYWSDPKNQRSA